MVHDRQATAYSYWKLIHVHKFESWLGAMGSLVWLYKSLKYSITQVSAQSDLSGGFSSSKNEPLLQSKCIWCIVSGGQNSLSGGK